MDLMSIHGCLASTSFRGHSETFGSLDMNCGHAADLMDPQTSPAAAEHSTAITDKGAWKVYLLFGGGPVVGAVHHLVAVVLRQDVWIIADALYEQVLSLPMVPVFLQRQAEICAVLRWLYQSGSKSTSGSVDTTSPKHTSY